jgi:hypothetical protein
LPMSAKEGCGATSEFESARTFCRSPLFAYSKHERLGRARVRASSSSSSIEFELDGFKRARLNVIALIRDDVVIFDALDRFDHRAHILARRVIKSHRRLHRGLNVDRIKRSSIARQLHRRITVAERDQFRLSRPQDVSSSLVSGLDRFKPSILNVHRARPRRVEVVKSRLDIGPYKAVMYRLAASSTEDCLTEGAVQMSRPQYDH